MAVNGFRDLPELLSYLEKRGLVRRISVPVQAEYEIAEITRRTALLENGGPVLLFENVQPEGFPVLTNLLGSTQRLAWSLSLNNLGELDQQMMSLLQPSAPLDLTTRLARLGETAYLSRFAPRQVRNAACQEVIITGETGLQKMPFLRVDPDDSGAAIRSVLVCHRSRPGETISVHPGDLIRTSDGLLLTAPKLSVDHPQPVALVIGGDPALLFATQAPLLPSLDPLLLACSLSHRRIDLVRCKSNEVEVPATAEIVLEGQLEPLSGSLESALSGKNYQVSSPAHLMRFRMSTLTHRKNPLLHGVIPVSADQRAMLKASERLMLPLLRHSLPEIISIRFPIEGSPYGLAIVAINKIYAGQAQRVMYGLWGIEQLRALKHILVVDADSAGEPAGQVLARALSRFDPGQDLLIVKGPLDYNEVGTKLGLDATVKLPGENATQAVETVPAQTLTGIRQLVDKKWLDYGIE